MSTFFNNLESYGLFLIYKMLIWTSRNIPNVGLFSAYAEVFLRFDHPHSPLPPFLCLRRGVSREINKELNKENFSLPTQRCFRLSLHLNRLPLLFSAYAEVFPAASAADAPRGTFLCLRRGVSTTLQCNVTDSAFSLPTQRCFL